MLVKERMSKHPILSAPDLSISEALNLMKKEKVRRLPIVDKGGRLVGIITETDLFKVFLEFLGARENGVRVTMLVANKIGELAKLTQAIASHGGNIMALVEYLGTDSTNREVMMKVVGLPKDKLVQTIQPLVIEVGDVREM